MRGLQTIVTSEEHRRPVRPVLPTGQTGWTQRASRNLEPQAREGPVGARRTRVVLGQQATQDILERRKEEQRIANRLEKLWV